MDQKIIHPSPSQGLTTLISFSNIFLANEFGHEKERNDEKSRLPRYAARGQTAAVFSGAVTCRSLLVSHE